MYLMPAGHCDGYLFPRSGPCLHCTIRELGHKSSLGECGRVPTVKFRHCTALNKSPLKPRPVSHSKGRKAPSYTDRDASLNGLYRTDIFSCIAAPEHKG